MPTAHKSQPCLRLDQIPGLQEVMVEARNKQFKTRENGWLGLSHDVCGFKIRTMTVLDYVLLERSGSPFIHRAEPTMSELALFLWILSEKFDSGKSQKIAAFIHGMKVRRKLGKNIPESSEPAVKKCFEYISEMFFDAPASIGSGSESCLTYLAGWFDTLQSEYNCPEESIWRMGIPRLFQSLKAISHRRNPSQPSFNQKTDSVKLFILRGLAEKRFTIEDLKSGKVKNEFRANLN